MKRRKVQRNMKNKCARKFVHIWETVCKTNTHRIQRCERCKGHNWLPLRD